MKGFIQHFNLTHRKMKIDVCFGGLQRRLWTTVSILLVSSWDRTLLMFSLAQKTAVIPQVQVGQSCWQSLVP